MQAEDAGLFALIEVAAHGVADLPVEAVQIVGFGEDGLAESAGGIAALRGLLDEEDELAHSSPSIAGAGPGKLRRQAPAMAPSPCGRRCLQQAPGAASGGAARRPPLRRLGSAVITIPPAL